MNHLFTRNRDRRSSGRRLRSRLRPNSSRKNQKLTLRSCLKNFYSVTAVITPMILMTTASSLTFLGMPVANAHEGSAEFAQDRGVFFLSQKLVQEVRSTLQIVQYNTGGYDRPGNGYGRGHNHGQQNSVGQKAIDDLMSLEQAAVHFSQIVSERFDEQHALRDFQIVVNAANLADRSLSRAQSFYSAQSSFQQVEQTVDQIEFELNDNGGNLLRARAIANRTVQATQVLIREAALEGRTACRVAVRPAPRNRRVRDHRRQTRIPARRGRVRVCQDRQKQFAIQQLRQLESALIAFQGILNRSYQAPSESQLNLVNRELMQARAAVSQAAFSGQVNVDLMQIGRMVKRLEKNLSDTSFRRGGRRGNRGGGHR